MRELIDNFKDPTASDYIGIGVHFSHKNKDCRVAIRLENDFTAEEFKKGWQELIEAMLHPETSNVIMDVQVALTGNEIVVREEPK